jgi:hypothetical protein
MRPDVRSGPDGCQLVDRDRSQRTTNREAAHDDGHARSHTLMHAPTRLPLSPADRLVRRCRRWSLLLLIVV